MRALSSSRRKDMKGQPLSRSSCVGTTDLTVPRTCQFDDPTVSSAMETCCGLELVRADGS